MRYLTDGLCCFLILIGQMWGQSDIARPAHPGDIVWTWSSECGSDNRLGVEVLVDGRVIYQDSIAICLRDRSAENGRVKSSFKGGHRFQGKYSTLPAQTIEGALWQAGAESDAIILGVSFMTKSQVLLNNLHIAKPDHLASSKVDAGIVVRTFPIAKQRAT